MNIKNGQNYHSAMLFTVTRAVKTQRCQKNCKNVRKTSSDAKFVFNFPRSAYSFTLLVNLFQVLQSN